MTPAYRLPYLYRTEGYREVINGLGTGTQTEADRRVLEV